MIRRLLIWLLARAGGAEQIPEPIYRDHYVKLLKDRIALLEQRAGQVKRRPFTQEEHAEILRLTKSGLKPRAIGNRLGRSFHSIETEQRRIRRSKTGDKS